MTQTMMKVRDVLHMLTASTDIWEFDGSAEGWMILMQEKAADSGFGGLIDALLEDGWAKGSSIGIVGTQICQGHHRLVAAILLGMDEIPVTQWGSHGGRNICTHSDPGAWNEFHLFDIPQQGY